MADYYPLLARAVAALPDSTPDARRAIYERARKALLGQLRRVEPPVPEADIQRESDALDAAAARVEADVAAAPKAAPPAPKPVAPDQPPPAQAASAAPQKPAPGAPLPAAPQPAVRPGLGTTPAARTAPQPASPPPVPVAARPAQTPTLPPPAPSPRIEAPAADRAPARPGLTPAIARERIWPPPMRSTPPVAGDPISAPPVAPPPPAKAPAIGSAAPAIVAKAPEAPAPSQARPTLPIIEPEPKTAPRAEPDVVVVPAPPDEVSTPPEAGSSGGVFSKIKGFGRSRSKDVSFDEVLDETSSAEPERRRTPEPVAAEPLRPIAPQAPVQRTSNLRYWVFAAVLLLVVGGIATLAFRLRDNPEDFARVTRPNPGAESQESQSGKIVERIGAGPSTSSQRQPAPTQQTPPSTSAPSQQATTPPPAQQTPFIPIAHRAALLIEAPDDPQRVKTFVGTVLWRIERTAGAPPSLVADLEMPDARFKASMRISKNTDPRLPASHTIDFRFTPAPDGEIPDVKEIDTLQMRAEDRPAGEALSGIPAAITANYFLVGLSSSESAQARNLDLLRTRGWFDLPMLLVSGKIAKITFEKGTTGDRMLTDVMAAWKAS